MSQITCRGKRPGEIGHQLTGAVAMIGDHVHHQATRPVADRVLGARQHPRRKRPADDRAQSLMARIIHHDDRAEILRYLGVYVVHGDAGH
jgi:hypothetical protein